MQQDQALWVGERKREMEIYSPLGALSNLLAFISTFMTDMRTHSVETATDSDLYKQKCADAFLDTVLLSLLHKL